MKMSVGNYCLRTGQTFSGKAHMVRISDSAGSPGAVATHLCLGAREHSTYVNDLCCRISGNFIYKNLQWTPACWPLLVLEEYYYF